MLSCDSRQMLHCVSTMVEKRFNNLNDTSAEMGKGSRPVLVRRVGGAAVRTGEASAGDANTDERDDMALVILETSPLVSGGGDRAKGEDLTVDRVASSYNLSMRTVVEEDERRCLYTGAREGRSGVE